MNPDLMDIFKSCRIVEHSGHGVPEVVKVYSKEAYQFSISTITVTISFDKTGFSQGGNVNKINKSEKLIMDAISTDGQLTIKEISQQTNLSERTVSRTLDSLKSKGLIYRVGSDKKGFNVNKGVTINFTENEKKVISSIKANDEITTNELSVLSKLR